MDEMRRARLHKRLFRTSDPALTSPTVKPLLHEMWDEVEREQLAAGRLREDVERALAAWDTTVLERSHDGRLQEAMECLRSHVTPNAN